MKDQIELPSLKVGALPTMNQDEYPGLGDWWVQLRTGLGNDEIFARVYGDSPEQAKQRAEAIAAIQADRQRTTELLKNPAHVHTNMCRGIIAPISFDQLAHVLGDEATEKWLADRRRRGEPVDIPMGWREQFKAELYDRYCAMDNQDFPLEDYPTVALEVLEKVVGPRHPTVVAWRNDGIKACIAIAYRYCRDPESHGYLKQDLEALITAAPQPAEPVAAPSENAITQIKRQRDGWMEENQWLRGKLVERQALLDSMLALQNNDTWHWMGDGEDHLESMGSQMRVVISAAELRTLLARYGAQPQPSENAAPTPPADGQPSIPDLLDYSKHPELYVRGWNDCCAQMLRQQDQSGYTAADMASASAQGFRSGYAACIKET